jgi:hypothetical protein
LAQLNPLQAQKKHRNQYKHDALKAKKYPIIAVTPQARQPE